MFQIRNAIGKMLRLMLLKVIFFLSWIVHIVSIFYWSGKYEFSVSVFSMRYIVCMWTIQHLIFFKIFILVN